MKTDSIFYRLFKEFPSSFFELIGRSPAEAQAYKFDSVELKQTAFRVDGLFIPTEENSPLPLYFVEVQFRRDPKVYANLFAEVFVYLNQNDPGQDWRGVVIYEKRSYEPTQLAPYRGLLNSPRVTRVYLDELPQSAFSSVGMGIVQLIVCGEAKVPVKVRELLDRTQQEVVDEQTRIDVLKLIETVFFYKFANKSRQELLAMFGVEDIRQTRLFQEILADGRAEGLAEGRAEGRSEGRAEGENQAKTEVIRRMLRRGFSVEEIADIVIVDIQRVLEVSQELEGEQNSTN